MTSPALIKRSDLRSAAIVSKEIGVSIELEVNGQKFVIRPDSDGGKLVETRKEPRL